MSADHPNTGSDDPHADQDAEPTLKAPESIRPDGLDGAPEDGEDQLASDTAQGGADSPDQDAEPTRNAPPEVRPDGIDSEDGTP